MFSFSTVLSHHRAKHGEVPQFLDSIFAPATNPGGAKYSPALSRAVRVLPVPAGPSEVDGKGPADGDPLNSLLAACEDAVATDDLGDLSLSFSDKPALVLPSVAKFAGVDKEFEDLMSYNQSSFKFIVRKEVISMVYQPTLYSLLVGREMGNFSPNKTCKT